MDAIVLLLAGDVMTGRGIDQIMAQPCPPALYEPAVRDARDYIRLAQETGGPIPSPVGPDYIWGDALREMQRMAPHARLVNLETAITPGGHPWPGKGIHYRMSPSNAGCLAAARIDACALANNHVLDWGREGLAGTLQWLRKAGIAAAGAGEDMREAAAPAVVPLRGGGNMLLFARATKTSGIPPSWAAAPGTPGVALLETLDESSARSLAAETKRRRKPGDVVVVSLHWGANWVPSVPVDHRAFARRLIDLGAADVVWGHSSHHPLPVEIYRGKLVIYGCGDLINDYEGITHGGPARSDIGCLYAATIERDTGNLRRLEVLPFQIRKFRLGRPDPDAVAWLAGIFGIDGAAAQSGALRVFPRDETQ